MVRYFEQACYILKTSFTRTKMSDLRDKNDQPRNGLLGGAKRVIIKVGTSVVTGSEGQLFLERIEPIVRSIAALHTSRQIVLVSSGAVGLGRGWLGLHPSRLKDMATKQACAAVGQSLLMEAYKRLFGAYDVKIAQVLLTEEDFSNWQRYSNLRRTMEKLIGFGVVPIVNENDTVSTAELEAVGEDPRSAAFSDNDRLAALVMSGLEADALILLTNVDGLLSATEASSKSRRTASGSLPRVIAVISKVTPEVRTLASGPTGSGRGGMVTKLEAAEIAMHCGGVAVIANGGRAGVLDRIFLGAPEGTVFLPSSRMKGKRRWLAYAAGVRGRVVVDAGAERAITRGKASLLSSGVVRVEKPFGPMDVVSIASVEGNEFARGIANCASEARATTRVLFTRDNIVLLEREA